MPNNDQIILDNIVDQERRTRGASASESEFFEMFVAGQVLKDADLTDDEIESGLVAGGGDGGIDGAFLFANGELVLGDYDPRSLKRNIELELIIIQAKRTAGFNEDAIHKLNAVTSDLFNLGQKTDQYRTVYNDDVRDFADRFRSLFNQIAVKFPKLRFSFYYATRGDASGVHPNVVQKTTSLMDNVRRLFSGAETEFTFLGANELLSLARRVPATSFDLHVSNTISTEGGAIALVKLRDYFSFITTEAHKLRIPLFEANVRDYQGSTAVNEDIQRTLSESTGEEFWWLNNGVTVLASRSVLSGRTLTVESPQIVNGLQTSTEIFNYFSSRESVDEKREVLVRVITPNNPESNDKIIKATNSQTSIPPASLRATDKIHRDIEEYLKKHDLYYDRRKNMYRNQGVQTVQIVSIPLMAQAIMSVCLGRPNDARARPSTLIKKDDDYRLIFDPAYPINLYLNAALVVKAVQKSLHSREDIERKDRNNIVFHASTVAASLLTGKSSPSAADIASIEDGEIQSVTIENAIEIAESIYRSLGPTDQTAKGVDFVTALKTKTAAVLSAV